MTKEEKEEVVKLFSKLPKEMQKGIVIGLAAGMEAGGAKTETGEKGGRKAD